VHRTSQVLFAVVLLSALLLSCRPAPAQTTLVMQIDTDASGITLTGSGSAATSLAFGSVRAFGGTVPTGVTKTVVGSTWTLSTPIDVHVSKGAFDFMDFGSTSYTLTAKLQAADAVNTWKWNSITLSTTAATITTTGTYNSTPAYTFALTVPFSAAAGTISNTISLTAVAN
jgi:hypothetical protein